MKNLISRILVIVAFAAASQAALAASARPVAFISDLHVGAGKKPNGQWREIEDFRWQADFSLFLDELSKRSNNNLDLVLAGDIFELWQSPTMKCSTDPNDPQCKVTDCISGDKDLGCHEQHAIARLDYILKQHPDFIASLRAFAAKGTNHVHLVPGNHDAALLFPGVADLVKQRFSGVRVSLLMEGFWVSPDGLVYSDHGHQSDQLNLFEKWPMPFQELWGTKYLRKSWGENMAQQFYNQYEVLFPIIDNLSDELTGASYAMKQASAGNVAVAISKLLKFIIIEESLRQAGRLGDGSAKVSFDHASVRAKPLSFIFPKIEGNADLKATVENVPPALAAAVPAFELTDEEIDVICLAKHYQDAALRCPTVTTTLTASVYGALLSPETIKAKYLRAVQPEIRKRTNTYFSLYVAGHSHISENPNDPLKLGDLEYGNVKVRYLNTGAFQRVASPEQLNRLLLEPRHTGKKPLDLQPEDLPACYNYVWVEPYAQKPVGKLHAWARDITGSFKTEDGQCLMR